jgi:Asp-tRNA(Asn)/Glu-tRNA(Gln) amidotransferase A subunit family amidase
MTTYRRAPIAAPVLHGAALQLFTAAVEGPFGSTLLGKITADSGLKIFRDTPTDGAPLQFPLPFDPSAPASVPTGVAMAQTAVDTPTFSKGPKLETVARFAEAYREKLSDPVRVARLLDKAIELFDDGPERMAFFISRNQEQVLLDAQASADRWNRGQPLSVLDGVPVTIKDELDVAGLPTTWGTRYRKEPARADSTVVARLKAAGAVVLGKVNMHEIGISTTGVNPHHGACRNPFDRTRITGGSSSGSAATVAAGLAPISIGADGGGSIRIPSGLCGVVGLKATFGRVSEAGVPPLCWNVAHAGPIGLTVADVAAAYALIAGPDERDVGTLRQSAVHLSGFAEFSLKGVRLGVCPQYFDDADPVVVARCQEALQACVDAGAQVVEMPPPDLNSLLWSHTAIILSEMAQVTLEHFKERPSDFGYDTRINLAIGRFLSSLDFVHALRHRYAVTREYLSLLQNVDAMVTPTTGSVAPPIPERALPQGESNLPVVDALMRFIRLGNLTGFPALAVPAGYDDATGLPVSLQFMGRPYQEHLLFRLGRVVETHVKRRLPKHHVTVL